MKKFGKFLLATLSVAAFAGGAYYFIKNIVNKDTADDFDDFEDDFDDFDSDDEEGTGTADFSNAGEDRGYVTLNITEDNEEAPVEAEEEPAESGEESSDEEEKAE